jgi:uncharacterized membrane protein
VTGAAAAGGGAPSRWRTVLRYILAAAMVIVGVSHFANPGPFLRIVPEALPAPLVLVYVSGAAEIGLGLLLLWDRTQRLAAYGLIALFVAVFPANINMAVNGIQLDPASPMPAWAAWARLPLQAVLIAWAWAVRGAPPPRDPPR